MSVRPTNEGPTYPTLSSGIGYDSGAATGDLVPPPDRAPGASIQTPASVTPALVQDQTTPDTDTVTFPSAVAAGNLLFLAAFRRNQPRTPTTPSGWTHVTTITIGSFFSDTLATYYKIADGTETSVQVTWTSGSPAESIMYVAEWSGASGLEDSDSATGTSGTAGTSVASSGTVVAAADALIIAALDAGATDGVSNTWTPGSGYTEAADVELLTNYHPTATVVYKLAAAGSHSPTATVTDGYVDWGGISHSFPTPGHSWYAAPGVNDDDNATYATVSAAMDGVIVRAALTEALRLATSTLRIGYSAAGSVTLAIAGANAADFSDAVTLDSETFTATGSYTSDTVTFTLPNTTAYQYYRIEGPGACRIYTWELYESNDAAAVVQITAHLADTADAHDASAISVLDTAGNYAATDVEAALTEIADTYMTESDVLALLAEDVYACDSLTATNGTIAAGAHTDLHAVGGTTVQINEATGVPGYLVTAAFSGVDGIERLDVHGYYTGNHTDMHVQLYNYDTTAWDTVVTFPAGGSSMTLLSGLVADGTPYFDGSGNAEVRFYHATSGNPSHRLYLDYLSISHLAGSTGGLALDGLTDVDTTGKSDQDVLTWDLGSTTWVAAAAPSGSGIPATLLDAKGDLIVASAADTAARLAVGSNTYVLTADSGQTLGVKWAAPSAAAAPTIPAFVQRITGSFSTGTTGLAVTMSAPTSGNRVLMWICAGARGATSITQTNVAWTNLYTTNGNSQYAELWVGVVSASAGTTATINFGSSTRVAAFGIETTTAYATAGTASTSTGSSSRGVYSGPLTTSAGDVVVGITSNNGAAYGISMPNVPYAVVSAGGQGNGFILSSPGCAIYSQSMFDAASNVIQALVIIS